MRSRIRGGGVRKLKGQDSESQREMGLEEEEVREEVAGVLQEKTPWHRLRG
jgi:hypothetical protein